MTEQYQDRVVRVFISSTFRDMHAEREELVKYTFPELRRRCRERHVEFVDVDLRWGVTEEQTERGEVLPICLAEIERCHPYFIGLLGERYGWVPEEIDQEIIDDQPWLEKHKEKSITELEILHGVLENKTMEQRSFFYFRDPELSQQVETALSEELDYQPEPEASKNKQRSLKESIVKKGYPQENYGDVKTLGQRVLDDVWTAIDEQFPEREAPSHQEQTRLEHEAFAAVRRNVYIGRQAYLDQLDAHVSSDDPPLMILGESGSGKSAFIANWVEMYRKKHPDDFVLLHFVGSTPDSADYVKLLQRIILEIKAHTEPEQAAIVHASGKVIPFKQDNEEEVPSDPQKLIEVFPQWLAKAAAKGKFILVLDGLNQLEDRDNALELTWLPQYIPPHVRLIVSTLPGRSLDALHMRSWPSLHIEPLDSNESRTLITEYLERFSKTLNESQIKKITDSRQTANPLYLQTLLDELRVFGSHKELNERIEYYLQATTIDALFDRMLNRLEQDYERDHPGLTREVMSLIWASRHGLSETELLEILNLPQAVWSPLKLAVEESLVSRSGLLNFFHDYLRQAVQKRYVKEQEHQQKVHLCIADYFQERALEQRKIEELPWQLQHAESWTRLKDCITEPAMFLELQTDKYKYELTRYWLGIGDRFDMTNCYRAAIEQYESTSPAKKDLSLLLYQTARFLNLNAKYEGSEPLFRRALAIDEAAYGPDHPKVTRGLNNLAGFLDDTNRQPEAEPLFRRTLAIDEAAYGPDHPDVARDLNNLASLLDDTNRQSEAEPLFRRALAIDEVAYGPDHPDVARDLNNLATLLDATNRQPEAEPLYRRALAIDEAAYGPDHPRVATGLNNLAELLRTTNHQSEAEPLYRRALAIDEAAYGPDHPDVARDFNNLALLLATTNRFTEAERLFRRALAIDEATYGSDHPKVAIRLNNLAGLLSATNRQPEAESLYRRALAIDKAAYGPDHPMVATVLNNLAELLRTTNRHTEAEPLYRRALAIDEAAYGRDHPDVAQELNNLALLLKATNRHSEAEPLYRRALAINEAAYGPDHPNVATGLNNLAALLAATNHQPEAEPLYRKALAIDEAAYGPDHPDVARDLNNLATLLDATNHQPEAEPLYRKALAIDEAAYGPEHPKVAIRLNNLAGSLYSSNRHEEAAGLFRRAMKICLNSYGSDHPWTQQFSANLKACQDAMK